LDHLARDGEEERAVLARDLGGVELLGARRHVEPLVYERALFGVELQPPHELLHEAPLGVGDLEIRPRERADELHEAKAIFLGQIGQRHWRTIVGLLGGGATLLGTWWGCHLAPHRFPAQPLARSLVIMPMIHSPANAP